MLQERAENVIGIVVRVSGYSHSHSIYSDSVAIIDHFIPYINSCGLMRKVRPAQMYDKAKNN